MSAVITPEEQERNKRKYKKWQKLNQQFGGEGTPNPLDGDRGITQSDRNANLDREYAEGFFGHEKEMFDKMNDAGLYGGIRNSPRNRGGSQNPGLDYLRSEAERQNRINEVQAGMRQPQAPRQPYNPFEQPTNYDSMDFSRPDTLPRGLPTAENQADAIFGGEWEDSGPMFDYTSQPPAASPEAQDVEQAAIDAALAAQSPQPTSDEYITPMVEPIEGIPQEEIDRLNLLRSTGQLDSIGGIIPNIQVGTRYGYEKVKDFLDNVLMGDQNPSGLPDLYRDVDLLMSQQELARRGFHGANPVIN